MSKSAATTEDQMHDVEEKLAEGLRALSLLFDKGQRKKTVDLIALMHKWNRYFNLTAIREPHAMVAGHVLDSLSVLPYLQGERILDIGSGAGIPGIPLAIALPEKKFTLVDSNGKKTRFMLQAVTDLGLQNIEVVKARVEDYCPGQGFDTVISRAFGNLAQMCKYAAHCCAAQGVMLVMKGQYPEYELTDLPQEAEIIWVQRLCVPGLENVERHLVCFRLKQV